MYDLVGYVVHYHIEREPHLKDHLTIKGSIVVLPCSVRLRTAKKIIINKCLELWNKFPQQYFERFEACCETLPRFALQRIYAKIRKNLVAGISEQKWNTWSKPPSLSSSTIRRLRPESILWKPPIVAQGDELEEVCQIIARGNALVWADLPQQLLNSNDSTHPETGSQAESSSNNIPVSVKDIFFLDGFPRAERFSMQESNHLTQSNTTSRKRKRAIDISLYTGPQKKPLGTRTFQSTAGAKHFSMQVANGLTESNTLPRKRERAIDMEPHTGPQKEPLGIEAFQSTFSLSSAP